MLKRPAISGLVVALVDYLRQRRASSRG